MKEGKVKRIDELVHQVLRQMGLEQRFKEQEVCEVWEEVVGYAIASRTREVSMADGRLFVSFNSATVRNEIVLVKEGLMRALNDRVGSAVIKEIIIK